MADNRYTAKIRAKRIELEYFKRLHPFRRWKLILSIVVPLVAGAWLIAYAARGDQTIYTSGTLSTAHAMWETACTDCHKAVPASADMKAGTDKAFFIPVHDRTCLSCHDGPIHAANMHFEATCASCHIEHKGNTQLAALKDNTCTQCHADLKTKDGKPPVIDATVSNFTSDHPEFAIGVKDDKGAVRRVSLDKKAELKDMAAIKLNHEKHLKVGLKGIEDMQKARGGKPIAGVLQQKEGPQLACAFCHTPDENRKNMQPISFVKHCKDCHGLDVDYRLPDAVAPHDTPQLVHAYLRTTFVEAWETCQTAQTDPKKQQMCTDLELKPASAPGGAPGGTAPEAPAERPRGRLRGAEYRPLLPPGVILAQARGGRLGRGGGEAPSDAPAAEEGSGGGGRGRGRFGRGGGEEEAPAAGGGRGGGALAWAGEQLPAAEKVMFKQKCEFCHVMTAEPNQLPKVAPTNIPNRWFTRSVFDHGAHRPLGCVECHKATASKETTDVLMPAIATCRECHREKGGAQSGCVECHLYHDKTKERDPNGPFTVPQLVKRQPASAGSASPR